MKPCPFSLQIQAFLDEELTDEEKSTVEQHLEQCLRCQEEFQRLVDQVAPEWPAPPPPDIPGYKVLGKLGQGGMGIVYKAWQTRLNRTVALKVILAGHQASPSERRRLVREARAVASLQHPNVVQLHDIGEHEGVPYLVLEYCSGGSLEKLLGNTPRSPREAALWVKTLAHAVHAVHTTKVIHRDLKPANVLVLHDGTLKISDFGLARDIMGDDETLSRDEAGTPPYMAPEQISAAFGSVGPATDIYALGAILYQCLTGTPPFRGQTKHDTLQLVTTTDPVYPRYLQPYLPRDLEAICLKCLEKHPLRRYESALALAEDLDNFLERKPVRAIPIGRIGQLSRWCQRNPSWAAMAAMAWVLLVALVAVPIAVALHERQLRTDVAGKLRESEIERAWNRFDKSLNLAEKGYGHQALLTLAQALEIAPADDADLQRVLRLNIPAFQYETVELRFPVCECPVEIQKAIFVRGESVIAMGGADGVVYLWDLKQSREISRISTGKGIFYALAASPDGKSLLTSHEGGAWVWDCTTGHLLATHIPDDTVVAAAYLPQGNRIVLGYGDGSIWLWDPISGAIEYVGESSGTVLGLGISEDGRYCAVCSISNKIYVLDLKKPPSSQKEKPKDDFIEKKPSPNHALFLASNTKSLLTISSDGTFDRWTFDRWSSKPLTAQQPTRTLHDLKTVLSITRGEMAGTLACLTNNSSRSLCVYRWALEPEGLKVNIGTNILSAAMDPTGTRVLLGGGFPGNPGFANFMDLETGHLSSGSFPHEMIVRSVTLSTDGRSILTGCFDNRVRLWDAETGQLKVTLEPQSSGITHLEFPSGDQPTRALVVDLEGHASIWDLRSGKKAINLTPDLRAVTVARYSPDGKLVAFGDNGGTVQVWDSSNGAQLFKADVWSRPVSVLAFSRDGRHLVGGSKDGTVWMADVDAKGTIHPHEVKSPRMGPITCMALNPDGRFVLVGCKNGDAALWDTSAGWRCHVKLPHSHGICRVAISGDSSIAATATEGEVLVRLWDVPTGQPLGPPISPTKRGSIHVLEFSPDGQKLLIAGNHSRVLVKPRPKPLKGDVASILQGIEIRIGKNRLADAFPEETRSPKFRGIRAGP